MQRLELHHPPEHVRADEPAPHIHGLVRIGDGFGEPAKLRARIGAIKIELCEVLARFLSSGRGVGVRPQLRNHLLVRLLAIEDRGDVGDAARRRDEVLWQRSTRIQLGRRLLRKLDRNVGAAVRGIERGKHAGLDLRRCLGAARLYVGTGLPPSLGLHARLHDRLADVHPAVLDRRLLGQRGGRTGQSQQNGDDQQFWRKGEVQAALKRTRGV